MNILDLKPATYVYDFQVTDSLGNVTTYFKGSILIVQDITQLTITENLTTVTISVTQGQTGTQDI
jgi:hypothetical protein